ncbi:MAG: hypothetical protein LBK47_03770 [Prevotellaceae bacterium]|jgi:hypothetical protein|nr:hypothetical protein [Prevotellaceae bacterium]
MYSTAKKIFLMALVSLFTVVAFSSCSKDDEGESNVTGNAGDPSVHTDGKISGKIVNMPDDINDFVLKCQFQNLTSSAALDAPVNNGEFSFTLPTPSDEQLKAFDKSFFYGEIPNVSSDARYVQAYFFIFPENSAKKFELRWYESQDGATRLNKNIWVEFWYVDKDVVITGEVTHGAEPTNMYNLNLKKGWNKVLHSYSKHPWSETTGNIPKKVIWFIQPS